MSVRTVDDLQRHVLADLGWRRKELHEFRSLVEGASSAAEQTRLRGAILLIYAHWEGFVRSVGEAYVDYVRARKLTFSEISSSFACLAVLRRLQEGASQGATSPHLDVVRLLLERPDKEHANIPRSNVVNARSNLNAEVFREIVVLLGLEYRREYATAEKPIIERLVELRNHIAHGGEYKRISGVEFEQLHDKTESLMVLFGNDTVNAAAVKAYLRSAKTS